MSDTLTLPEETSVAPAPAQQTATGSTGGQQQQMTGTSDPVNDFITHAVNQATFQLPEGLIKGTPVAKSVNTLLGGLPENLINAAGGKQKLAETLARKSTAGSLGNIAGSLAPLALGQPESLVGMAGAGAAEQAGRSLMTGDKDIAGSAAMGAVGGAAGFGAGKVLGKVLGGLAQDPTEAIANAANTAKKTYLANAIPDLSTRDFKQWVKNGAGGAGMGATPEAAREEISKLYSIIRDNNLDNKVAQDAFRRAQPERWQAINDAVDQSGLKLSDMGQELSSLDAVQKYKQVMKDTAVSGQVEDPLTKIISDASGGVEGGPARSFYDTRATLNSQAEQAYKFSKNSALPAGNYQPEQQRALAQALQAVDDAYFNKATQLVPENISNGIKADWATQKLLGLAASRGETSIGGFRLAVGSGTASRLQPGNIVGNLMGPAIQGAAQAATRPIARGIAGATADVLGNPAVAKGAGALAGLAGKVANPAVLGTLGAAGMGEGNNGGGQNGAPGGNGGTGWMGGTTPGGRSTVAPGAVNSFAAQAVNAKYGYPNSSLDDAVLNGIDTLFNQRYKPAQEFKGHPELQQQFYNDYKDQMLRGLHTRPGGAIDPQLAARVLFPGQDEQQGQFTNAARQNVQLTQLLHGNFQNGQPNGDGALDTAGLLGIISRNLPGGASKNANYNALKAMVEKEAGTPGKNSFDQIMNNPKFTRDEKEEAIRSIFKNGSNAAGWQYFTDAIGGKR
jgi:hypothetical protein